MNNELILYSPPNEDKSERPKIKTKNKRYSRNAARFASFFLTLNFMLCSVFFVANRVNTAKLTEKAVYGLFFGGILEMPRKESLGDTEAPPSLPASADPLPLETTDKIDDPEAVPTIAEAFIRLYEYDLSLVPEGLYPIIPYDLSSEGDGVLRLYNDTYMDVDINSYANAEVTEQPAAASEEPIVLIIHTHGTEAYSEEGALGYSETYNIPRSHDVTKNVVAIGRIMTRVLNESGVTTVQCDVMHDAQSYLGAYERSAETIKDYLKRYPSIKYVFDVHRDSVLLEDKTKTRPVTIANGKTAAQIMTVAGSDEMGVYHPDWEKNLNLAAKLQTALNKDHLGLARAICLRGSSYNQELAPYSLLFEVGSCGNTFAEASHSAEILANTLAELIKNGW